MTLYPTEPRQRRTTMVRDALVVLTLVLLAWLGRRVYRLVDDLRSVTDAVQDSGSSVQGGFSAAADVLAAAPLVGDDLAGALEAAGAASGGNIVELALTGDTAIHRLALALGILTFALPAVLVVVLYAPVRVAQARRLRAALLAYREPHDPERRRLLAMRAALSLPVDDLVEYTDDPMGDLLRGDHDALVTALLADAGLSAHEVTRA